ncbi:hypothetical protein [Pseudonocardia oroxyli]|uniref:hypothetical protein n=1 Tax=Pseudonocardia oroxyli TaxID=366584 RepID=UPI0015A39069|nr:hypothetical protein [Pseudonocardia oroxyli]
MSETLFTHDSPQEFFQESFSNTGYCDAQSILPQDGHYHCHCTCGRWDVDAPDRETGVNMAREHTREITERELAKRERQDGEGATP